ncbi:MAG TPA: acetate kinase [Ruminococcaceae bacterium]|nr:acetate kinase [Oscillospiraceae bacterium]
MKILVINAGSSSLKYQLFDIERDLVLAKGVCERIGIDGRFKQTAFSGAEVSADVEMPNHTAAFEVLSKYLTDPENGVIASMGEISAVGHRVVQGGSHFSHSVKVNEENLKRINELCELAPLHNPAAVQGINACLDNLGGSVPQVMVFDTSFHQTMPEEAYMFALPYEYYEKYQIRRYGFHGTSHRFVSKRCAELMNKDIKDLKIITCHLGNGSSITAVNGGKSVDTSMGFTPLDGFMMGTRTGAVDPSAVTYIMEKEGLSPSEIIDILNKKSGALGVSGVSSDDRDVQKAALDGNQRAALTLKMLRYQIRKYIGQYMAAMNGVDAIVFTGGIGENVRNHREDICLNLSVFGVDFDSVRNMEILGGIEGEITLPGSKIRVFVIPTNEEKVIALDTKEIVERL